LVEKRKRRPKRKKTLYAFDLDGDGRKVLESQILEKEFQNQLRTYARLKGWLYYHPYDSRKSDPGFPDTVLARDDRTIFAELKKVGGRLSSYQRLWTNTLKENPALEVYIWYPSDWDKIEEILE